jgi:hypothetical protein
MIVFIGVLAGSSCATDWAHQVRHNGDEDWAVLPDCRLGWEDELSFDAASTARLALRDGIN